MKAFWLLPLVLALCGCAAPRRKASSTHEVRSYQGRADGMVRLEEWTDSEGGGGIFVLTTSSSQSIVAVHTNQHGLGGGSTFQSGPISITGDPATVEALGSAIGKVVGEALKTAAKP